MDNGEPLQPHLERVTSANAYLGAQPVAEALRQGADIVLCGRITDTALALGPLLAEFGWAADDWDRLAAGTIAGPHPGVRRPVHRRQLHALLGSAGPVERRLSDRRGARGRHVHGDQAPGHRRAGHRGHGRRAAALRDGRSPRVHHARRDRRFHLASQLRQEGPDRVAVSGIRGGARTPFLKVSASYLDGYKASGQLTVAGPRALEKARLAAEIVWRRLERAGVTFARARSLGGVPGRELLSARRAARAAPIRPRSSLRLGVRDQDRAKVDRFGKELAPLVTAGPPGVTGFAGGRPKAQEVVAYWPALLDRATVEPHVRVSVEAA